MSPRRARCIPTPFPAWADGALPGVISAILVWAPVDPIVVGYVWAIAVLFVGSGITAANSRHRVKFAGQALAVLPIVVMAGLYITRFPFIDGASVPTGIAIGIGCLPWLGMGRMPSTIPTARMIGRWRSDPCSLVAIGSRTSGRWRVGGAHCRCGHKGHAFGFSDTILLPPSSSWATAGAR